MGRRVRDVDGGRPCRVRLGPVDVAVVEAGLGGRRDATNVLGAPVVILTNVGLEHTEVLGYDAGGDRSGEARRGRPGSLVVAARARVGGGRARRRRRRASRSSRARASVWRTRPWIVPRERDDQGRSRRPVPGRLERVGRLRWRSGTGHITSPGSATCSRASRAAAVWSSPDPRGQKRPDARGSFAPLGGASSRRGRRAPAPFPRRAGGDRAPFFTVSRSSRAPGRPVGGASWPAGTVRVLVTGSLFSSQTWPPSAPSVYHGKRRRAAERLRARRDRALRGRRPRVRRWFVGKVLL